MKKIAILLLWVLLLLAPPVWAAKLAILKGITCADSTPRACLINVFIQDSSSTTGAGLTGLTNLSSNLVCYYARSDQGDTAGAQLTLAAGTRGTWSSGGFKEKDATNMAGVYEIGLSTASVATGSNFVVLMCKGATNMAPMLLEIQLTNYDPQDGVRLGVTALPNAVAGASGGVLISGSNAGTTTLGALTVTDATTLTGGLTGNITGNLSGSVGSVTGAVGSVTGAVGSVTGAVGSVTGSVTVGTNSDKTGYGLSGTQTFNNTGTWTGNVTGSVGSVTGAVGSVTGAVGSVTGAVGSLTTNNDKTGYSLTVTPPTAAQVATTIWQDLTAGADFGTAGSIGALLKADIDTTISSRSTYAGADTAGTTTLLTRLPSAITLAAGAVTVGTNNDKTGYSLTQTFPTNFSSLSIDASGRIDLGQWIGAAPNALINSRVPIAAQVQQNVALASFAFLMTDSTNHTPVTGLTPTCTRSLDGGAFGAGTLANVAEVAFGFYKVDFGAGDLNGKVIVLRCTAANADDMFTSLISYP